MKIKCIINGKYNINTELILIHIINQDTELYLYKYYLHVEKFTNINLKKSREVKQKWTRDLEKNKQVLDNSAIASLWYCRFILRICAVKLEKAYVILLVVSIGESLKQIYI